MLASSLCKSLQLPQSDKECDIQISSLYMKAYINYKFSKKELDILQSSVLPHTIAIWDIVV